ncbi:MAG: hypothetical protein NZ992_07970 [Candidatus Korarchaeum sp.]|nr:hypothetical protein [Candidatus Korarchaeum sp.]MDW8035299.1 hypothetical protein [Candidatus Korarchaeum sp.]
MRVSLISLLEEIREGKSPKNSELVEALRDLRERFSELSHEILSERYKIPLREVIRRGIILADEDLFLACEEHDSLRREAYQTVKSMDWQELERASTEIIVKNLERTLLGSFIMRRVS